MKPLKQYTLSQIMAMIDVSRAYYSEGVRKMSDELLITCFKNDRDQTEITFSFPIMTSKGVFGQGPDDTEDRFSIQHTSFTLPEEDFIYNIEDLFGEVCGYWDEEQKRQSNM